MRPRLRSQPETTTDLGVTVGERPFYHEFAWAYDALVDDPVAPFVDVVEAALKARHVGPDSRVLDAGCGTGRYTVELARRGFHAEGFDASAELVEHGLARNVPAAFDVRLRVGDLLSFETQDPFDAVLCRGVLNDVISDELRGAAISRLVSTVRPAGVLVLDVRDWSGSIEAIRRRPIVQKSVEIGDVLLRFSSTRRVDEEQQHIVSTEEFSIDDSDDRSVCTFVMRPWSDEELRETLARAGCATVECFAGSRDRDRDTVDDRILCVATRA